MISAFPYVHCISVSGDIRKDVKEVFLANGKEKTFKHCKQVAQTCAELARNFGLDEDIAYTSGLLHDISAIVKPSDMMRYAIDRNWTIDESEKRYPFILHQRISAEIVRDYFMIHDPAIISAIACHSTLKENPSNYDMLLFLSDKISWDQEGIPPFYDILRKAIDTSLEYASLTYINYALDQGMIFHPHQWLLDARQRLGASCAE